MLDAATYAAVIVLVQHVILLLEFRVVIVYTTYVHSDDAHNLRIVVAR